MTKVLVAGGGLAGLVAANHLLEYGIEVILIEKKKYPFHRVCGEYISNEVIPYLKSLALFPQGNFPQIKKFQLTSVNGKSAFLNLDLGGFGISRFTFDYFLYQEACRKGLAAHVDQEVESITFSNDQFYVKTNKQEIACDLVVGSFGKRSKLDVQLQREFIKSRSPYAAVKYHIRTDQSAELISLHNFKDGYCGISKIEDEKFTLCYLTHRNNLKEHGSIKEMERQVLFKNPFLKSLFENSEFLFDRPETINEISFATKTPVHNHILMAGDAAGMITPLCGNGMALAIHSAKLASELILQYSNKEIIRANLEQEYTKQWNSLFARRLWVGRQIQQLFGAEWTSNLSVGIVNHIKPVANFLMKQTHGTPF